MLSQEVEKKYANLQAILKAMGTVALGYSGGVDSTLLLKAAADVLGQNALAMIGRSETFRGRGGVDPKIAPSSLTGLLMPAEHRRI